MNIAFIITGQVVSAASNGVISQAKTWQKGLENKGHNIELINPWIQYDWADFDIILYFGLGGGMASHIATVSKINPNIVVAPICDPGYSVSTTRIYMHWGIRKLKLSNYLNDFNIVKHLVKAFLVRSEFEKRYIVDGYGTKEERCHIVPLSYKAPICENEIDKEDFCLHISYLTDKRKNVKRLIDAAKKYNFKLVLAGRLRTKDEERLFHSWVDGANNIEYRGFVSQEEKIDLYRRAKVFALPSINEGVGIVGLEAASQGCNIVVTSIGGPKEYYNGMARIVNPYKTKEIGEAVVAALSDNAARSQLKTYVEESYSLDSVTNLLLSALLKAKK